MGDKRQEMRDMEGGRWETKDQKGRREAEYRRWEMGDGRWETGDRRQETGDR